MTIPEPERFTSRKFIITMLTLTLTTVLAFFGKMDGNIATVFSACVGGYHLANAYTTGKGGAK